MPVTLLQEPSRLYQSHSYKRTDFRGQIEFVTTCSFFNEHKFAKHNSKKFTLYF